MHVPRPGTKSFMLVFLVFCYIFNLSRSFLLNGNQISPLDAFSILTIDCNHLHISSLSLEESIDDESFQEFSRYMEFSQCFGADYLETLSLILASILFNHGLDPELGQRLDDLYLFIKYVSDRIERQEDFKDLRYMSILFRNFQLIPDGYIGFKYNVEQFKFTILAIFFTYIVNFLFY